MKVISFVNMKGGVGKTTVAVNVAHILANRFNKKVALLDVDPQFNATQCIFKAEEYVDLIRNNAPTILEVFDKDEQRGVSVLQGIGQGEVNSNENIVLQEKHGIHILPGNIDLYRLETRTGEGREFELSNFIEEQLGPLGFDFVIIDTPPTPSVWMTSALIASQYYLVVTKPDPLSIVGIDLLRNIIEKKKRSYKLNLACCGLVLTMIERPDSQLYRSAKESLSANDFFKKYLYESYLPKRKAVAEAQLEGSFIAGTQDVETINSMRNIVREMLVNLGEEEDLI